MSRITKEKVNLQCALTDEEKLRYGSEMSRHLNDLRQCEDSLASFKSQIKGEIETHEARINALSQKIYSGKEFRDVECEIEYDWEKKTRHWIRTDTGEIFKEEPIPECDLQEEMELKQNGKGKK